MLQDLSPPWHIKAEFLIVLLRLAVLLHRGRSQAAHCRRLISRRRGGRSTLVSRRVARSHPLTATDLENEIEYLKAVGFRLRVT